jgi:hypothetical protein
VETHSLAPGNLNIGLFKNIPLGKCTCTFVVVQPPTLVPPGRPESSAPIEVPLSSSIETSFLPVEVATLYVPFNYAVQKLSVELASPISSFRLLPVEVATPTLPPDPAVLEPASVEMPPSIEMESQSNAALHLLIKVMSCAFPTVTPIPVPSSSVVPMALSARPSAMPIVTPPVTPIKVPSRSVAPVAVLPFATTCLPSRITAANPMLPLSSRKQLCKKAKSWWPFQPDTPCDDPFEEMIAQDERRFHKASSWEEFIEGSRDPRGDLSPGVKNLPHRAGHILNRWCVSGAPVVTKTKPWSLQQS